MGDPAAGATEVAAVADDPADAADREPVADPEWLETWAVATFGAVMLGLLLVVAGHAAGVLADVLAELDTLVGFAVFGYLWALAVASTRVAQPATGLDRVRTRGARTLLVAGALAGTLTGAAFVLGAALVAGLPLIVFDGANPAGLLVVGGLGTAVGGVLGGGVGTLLAVLDVVLFRVALVLAPES